MPYAFQGVELVGDPGGFGPGHNVLGTGERCLPGVVGAVGDEQGSFAGIDCSAFAAGPCNRPREVDNGGNRRVTDPELVGAVGDMKGGEGSGRRSFQDDPVRVDVQLVGSTQEIVEGHQGVLHGSNHRPVDRRSRLSANCVEESLDPRTR